MQGLWVRVGRNANSHKLPSPHRGKALPGLSCCPDSNLPDNFRSQFPHLCNGVKNNYFHTPHRDYKKLSQRTLLFFFRELLEKNQRALNYHQFWSSEAKKRENAYAQDWWDEIERPGFWIQNPRLEFQFCRLCNLESRFLHLWDVVQFYTLAPPGVWWNPGVLKKNTYFQEPHTEGDGVLL